MKLKNIVPTSVVNIPDKMEIGKLYISNEYKIAVHLCCCGCGNESITPISEGGWNITESGNKVTLHPSILNRICKAHYFIESNEVRWC